MVSSFAKPSSWLKSNLGIVERQSARVVVRMMNSSATNSLLFFFIASAVYSSGIVEPNSRSTSGSG